MADQLQVKSVLWTREKVKVEHEHTATEEYVYHCYGHAEEATCRAEGARLQRANPKLECMVCALEHFPEDPAHIAVPQVLKDPWGRCC